MCHFSVPSLIRCLKYVFVCLRWPSVTSPVFLCLSRLFALTESLCLSAMICPCASMSIYIFACILCAASLCPSTCACVSVSLTCIFAYLFVCLSLSACLCSHLHSRLYFFVPLFVRLPVRVSLCPSAVSPVFLCVSRCPSMHPCVST